MLLTLAVDNAVRQKTGLVQGDLSLSTLLGSVLSLQGLVVPMYGSNLVFWTLSIEIHLYLFYPVLFYLGRRHGAWASLLVAFALSAGFFGLNLATGFTGSLVQPQHGEGLFVPYLFMWAGGAFIADLEAKRARLNRGVLWNLVWPTMLAAGVAAHSRGLYYLSPLLLAVGVGGAVDLALRAGPSVERYARHVTLAAAWIGMFSYSLYATHRIVFELINLLGLGEPSKSVFKALAATAAAVGVARIFYALVEKSALDLSRPFVSQRRAAFQEHAAP